MHTSSSCTHHPVVIYIYIYFLIVCFTSYFVFRIAVLPHSPGVVYYNLLLRRETRIPGVAPFSFRIGIWDLFVHRGQNSQAPMYAWHAYTWFAWLLSVSAWINTECMCTVTCKQYVDVHDEGLVINYGEGGGLQNGKIACPKLFAPPPLKTGYNFSRPPLLRSGNFSPPPLQ